jgi:hypothetical protein
VLDDPATRYPRIEPDAIASLGHDLVLLPSEPYSFGAADAGEMAGWSGARVELVDGRVSPGTAPGIPAALAVSPSLLRRCARSRRDSFGCCASCRALVADDHEVRRESSPRP